MKIPQKAFIHLEHLFGLFPLVGVHNSSLTVSVRVTDQRGDLTNFLLLEDIGLGPDP